MTKIKLFVHGANAWAEVTGELTSGMVGIPVEIVWDNSWDGLNKTLVCRCGETARSMVVTGEEAMVAHEVMTAMEHLELGLEGRNADGSLVIPSVWADCGMIREGTSMEADPSADPTLPVWAQLQGMIGDLAQLNTDAKENLVAAVNEALTKGGGEADPAEIQRIVEEYLTEKGGAGNSGIVDSELSEDSENPVQNKAVTAALRNKAELEDVYVEVETAAAEAVAASEKTVAASVEEYSFISSDAVKNYMAKTVSCSPGSDVPIYVTSVKIAVRSGADYAQECKFSIWEFTKTNPDSATDKNYTLTKVRDCGSVVPSDNLAEITFPEGELVEPNQLMMASSTEQSANADRGWLAYGSKDYENSAIVYAYSVTTIDSEVGDSFTTAIPGDWTGVFTTTYTLEPPVNAGDDSGEDSGDDSGGSTNQRKIKEVIPEILADLKVLETAVGNIHVTGSNSRSTRKPVNKYFTLTVDDVEAPFLTIADRLIEIGFYPALALKMESINNGAITWDDVRTLQNMGFEIAFHGMLHSHTPAGTAPDNDAVMIADIAEYKALCEENGIDIVGYCGPNHYPLPVDAFQEFEWARSPYGLTTYGAGSRFADSFASVIVWSCELTGSDTMEETKTTMIAEADKLADNQYLTPMCHSQNIVAYIDDYMEVFNAWMEKGLTPMRCRDAVKQSLWECGGIGSNSTFDVQAGTATAPYWVVAGNGTVRSSQSENG